MPYGVAPRAMTASHTSAPWCATPYGTEAMHVLRAEKGYVIVGQETDGTQTPQDLGLEWLVSDAKPDFIGRRSHARAGASDPDRKRLVGLLPVDPGERQLAQTRGPRDVVQRATRGHRGASPPGRRAPARRP